MRTPHTHYTKGKTVWVKLRNGEEVIGKFMERKGRYVVLDNAKIQMQAISAMSYRKHQNQP